MDIGQFRDFEAMRKHAKALPPDRYEPVERAVDGETFEEAKVSLFLNKIDKAKVSTYYTAPIRFGEHNWGLMQTLPTVAGIGVILTYRGEPRYVVDPGARWRSSLAARLRIPRKDLERLIAATRLVARLMEAGPSGSKIMSLEQELQTLRVDLGVTQAEVAEKEEYIRYLERELARRGGE